MRGEIIGTLAMRKSKTQLMAEIGIKTLIAQKRGAKPRFFSI